MKFRAKINDSSYIERFHHALSMITKFSKHCLMRISVDGLFLITFEESGERQPMLWCKIPQQQYFSEFNFVGVSEQYNEICLKFSTHALTKVLASFKSNAIGQKSMKISLTNRKTPCLTCELFKGMNHRAT